MKSGKLWQSSAMALLMIMAVPASGHSEEVVSVEIPPQDMVGAITRLGNIAGVQIIGPDELLANRTSASVSGIMTAKKALSAILNNDTFGISELADGTLVINNNVQAQTATGEEDETVLDRIVVDGELLERDIQDTTTSVTIVTGEKIERRSDPDIYTVIERTPGITNVQGERGFSIRGVNQAGFNAGRGNSLLVSTTVDGAVISDFADIVPRGPYSTW
ncbi:MAG: Plug domain-containing protein, partial [Pseudomonadota bacterium]